MPQNKGKTSSEGFRAQHFGLRALELLRPQGLEKPYVFLPETPQSSAEAMLCLLRGRWANGGSGSAADWPQADCMTQRGSGSGGDWWAQADWGPQAQWAQADWAQAEC